MAMNDDPISWTESTFLDANRALAAGLERWGIQRRDLNFDVPEQGDDVHGKVRHAALHRNGTDIAVNTWSSQLHEISVEMAAGILAHEYGHVLYRSTANGFLIADGKAPCEEEEFAEWRCGSILSLSRISPAPYIEFLRRTVCYRPVADYPELMRAIWLVQHGFENPTMQTASVQKRMPSRTTGINLWTGLAAVAAVATVVVIGATLSSNKRVQ